MNIEDLKKNFEKRVNKDNAIQTAKYLRNQFVFYGLKSPVRRDAYHQILKDEKKKKQIDWDLLDQRGMISIVKCNILFVIICLQWRNMSAMMIYLK